MKNDTCIMCGEKFEPKENKMYCSDACKQKAYSIRKISEEKEKNVVYTISMSELKKVQQIDDSNEGMGIEVYAFIRKNLQGSVNVEFIVDYIANLSLSSFFDNVRLKGTVQYDEYQKFLKLFHYGGVKIVE